MLATARNGASGASVRARTRWRRPAVHAVEQIGSQQQVPTEGDVPPERPLPVSYVGHAARRLCGGRRVGAPLKDLVDDGGPHGAVSGPPVIRQPSSVPGLVKRSTGSVLNPEGV